LGAACSRKQHKGAQHEVSSDSPAIDAVVLACAPKDAPTRQPRSASLQQLRRRSANYGFDIGWKKASPGSKPTSATRPNFQRSPRHPNILTAMGNLIVGVGERTAPGAAASHRRRPHRDAPVGAVIGGVAK
jgi:hypothetical protein